MCLRIGRGQGGGGLLRGGGLIYVHKQLTFSKSAKRDFSDAYMYIALTYIDLTVCYYITWRFHSESKLYSSPECQETPCLKQAQYLKFNRQQQDSNLQPLRL